MVKAEEWGEGEGGGGGGGRGGGGHGKDEQVGRQQAEGIVDEKAAERVGQGQPVLDGDPGDICVRGWGVFACY